MPTNSKQQTIVETAYKLFKNNGFYATGVDFIMREAGVSKRTLYKYFPTKNDLIIAVLEHYRSIYRQHLDELLDHQQLSASDKIGRLFQDAMHWFGDVNFHGCLAVNAMGEFADKHRKIEDTCLEFKQWEIGVLIELCHQLQVSEPEQLAYKLFVLLEGMSAIAQVNKALCPVDMVKVAEEIILQHQ